MHGRIPMTENEKFEAVVKEIVRVNPNNDTAKELIKVLQKHIQVKSMIVDAIDYALWGSN